MDVLNNVSIYKDFKIFARMQICKTAKLRSKKKDEFNLKIII